MFYSVVQVKGPMVLTEDFYGELQVFAKDFFDYDVQENDMVYLKDGMLRYAKEATEQQQAENYDRMNSLFDR